jgi:hypothetical protein
MMRFAMSPVVRSVIVASLIVIGSPIKAQEAPAPAASSEKPGVTGEEKRERAEDAIDEAADATKSAIERAKEAVIDAIKKAKKAVKGALEKAEEHVS